MNKKYFLKLILLVFCTVTLFGCATGSKNRRVSNKNKKTYLQDVCAQYEVECSWDQVTQVVSVRQGSTIASILMSSNMVLFQNEKIMLNKPIKMAKDGGIIVSDDFSLKVLSRFKKPEKKEIIAKENLDLPKPGWIVLDPGHGGKDPGAIGRNNLNEKEVVLDIAKRLERELEKNNLKVTMTRSKDEFISLEERARMTNRLKADVFVSIHANSSPDRNARGMEVYSLKELEYLEKKGDDRKASNEAMFSNLAMRKNNKDVEKIIEDILYAYKQKESPVLAQKISKRMSHMANVDERGCKLAKFHVLRNTLVPAVLVEVGFVTNPQEARLLSQPAYRQRIAEGIAKGLIEYVQAN